MALGAHASRRKADVKNKENPFPYWCLGMFILAAFAFLVSAVDLITGERMFLVIIDVVVILSALVLMYCEYKAVMVWAHRQDVIEQRRKEEGDNPLDKMDRWN